MAVVTASRQIPLHFAQAATVPALRLEPEGPRAPRHPMRRLLKNSVPLAADPPRLGRSTVHLQDEPLVMLLTSSECVGSHARHFVT